MHVRYSPKKKIPVIEMSNDIEINMTNDDPITLVLVKAKIRNRGTNTLETISDLVDITKFKSNLHQDIKRKANKKEIDKISKLFRKYIEEDILTRKNLKKFLQEILNSLSK